MLNLFDYGILIASADDTTFFRKKKVLTPRDNVIFELGLFSGRLGRFRSFLLVEQGIKIPSDLLGITLPPFPSGRGQKQNAALRKECKKIVDEIEQRRNIFDFGFLPSTALAFGYFNNFISKAISTLNANPVVD